MMFELCRFYPISPAKSTGQQGVSWKTGKPGFLVNWEDVVFIYSIFFNIDNDKSKQKYTQSHSSYKIETFLL